MAEWFENQILIDGAVAPIQYDVLDEVLASEYRWASWIGVLCRDAPVPGDGTRSEQLEAFSDDSTLYVVPGGPEGFTHDHCRVTFCGITLEWSADHAMQTGYYCPEDGWLCRQCGEALLKWRETAECRAYMERRARGLAGPPG